VFNTRLDIIAPTNSAREFWPNWDHTASNNVALLRTEASRDPNDPAPIELIGQLSIRGEQFGIRWGATTSPQAESLMRANAVSSRATPGPEGVYMTSR
jgi:hypothetical protein